MIIFITWLPDFFPPPKHETRLIFHLELFNIDAKQRRWTHRLDHQSITTSQSRSTRATRSFAHATLMEAYLLPSRAVRPPAILGSDRRGLLPLAAFPLLSPLPCPHPPSFELARRGSGSPRGCSHHYCASTSLLWRIFPALSPPLSDPILSYRRSTQISSLKLGFFFFFFFEPV